MIATLTMNPAVDRTVIVNGFRSGGLNRVKEVRVDASGKGINVSKALLKLGFGSMALGFLGGNEGKFIVEEAMQAGIAARFTWLEGRSTRTNVKVFDEATGETTELNEPGPLVREADLERLNEDIDRALRECTHLICSGSLPPGVPDDFYANLVERANERGVYCVLDTNGPALVKGIRKRPFMIKPNSDEIADIMGRPLKSAPDLVTAVKTLLAESIVIVILSLGADGAIFGSREGIFWSRAPAEVVRSTAGCGDALVAATVASLASGRDWEETARFATAVAVATVGMEGTAFPSLDEVERVVDKVQVNRLPGGSAA